jgi:integrase/recombinase XerD
MEELKYFNELMFLKNFGKGTVKAYNSTITIVSVRIKKPANEIDEIDLRGYLIKNKKLSSSSRMAVINAFKCYYRLCFDRDFNHKILPRPKVEQKQPDVLSLGEIQSILDAIINLKHKCIVSLMYSCALRVGEVTSLKLKDLDSKNNKITIKNVKGKVDIIVMLDK